ncbi:hypothetical protein [Aliihoeflea sp. 2WW]|uniref:hypothetical protein n=1 Tax=Aliihoeflea sp. 2WW TaxID=1381123 RepID=UPI001269596B|nr:hypothetical protein [Aliihoeflea sp. 2WW]
MRNIIATIGTVALLAGASAANANDDSVTYYSGSFSCSGRDYTTDWTFGRQLGTNASTATVYFQRSAVDRVEWLDLVEQAGSDALIDANGNPRLRIARDNGTILADWLRGAPDQGCEPFAVSQSKSPKERFDELFTFLETSRPDAAAANAAAGMLASTPIIYALPELDQQLYLRRLSEMRSAFWTRYRDGLVSDFAQVPLETDSDRNAFVQLLAGALSGPMELIEGRNNFRDAFAAFQQAVDRYEVAGSSAAADMYPGGQIVCQRFSAIQDAAPGYDFDKLEFATGLPSDYWSRDIAEDLLETMRECHRSSQGYANELARQWPEMQRTSEIAQALRREQSRLLGLPVEMSTLIDTKNLQPDAAVVSNVSTSSQMYHRFFGQPLERRREELIQASLASIAKQSESYMLDEPEIAQSVSDACDALRSSVSRDRRDVIQQACTTATKSISDRQRTEATAQIAAAFADAEPGTDAAKEALALCENLPRTLSFDARDEVYRTCQEAGGQLQAKERALRCDIAVAKSGASPEFLTNTVSVRSAIGSRNVELKELICHGIERDVQVSFSSSGYLMWKKQEMLLDFPGPAEKVNVLRLVLNPSETDADWTIDVEDSATHDELAREGIDVESVTACLLGRC